MNLRICSGVLLRIAMLACCALMDSAQAAPPSIEDFFRAPEFARPELSPDGTRIAVVVTEPGQRSALAVIDVQHLKDSKTVAVFDDADVGVVHWVNNHRLVYTAWDAKAERVDSIWPGLWAVDDDGQNARHLIYSNGAQAMSTGTQITDRTLPWHWTLHSTLDDDSDDVLIEDHVFSDTGQPTGTALARLDTRHGSKRAVVDQSPAGAEEWWADGQGHVIAVLAQHQDRSELLVPDGSAWKSISQGNFFTNEGHRFEPVSGDVPGWLFVAGPDPEGHSDTTVLSRLDLNHPEAPPKVLLSLAGYDFDGELVVDHKAGKLLGIQYETDAGGTAWFDPAMKAMQAEIDQQLPATINKISCRNCLSDEVVLVTSSSDHQPSVWSSYEPAKHKLMILLNSRRWIDPRQMGQREYLHFKARDGMEIPILITRPPGPAQAHRPAVMLVHGGPWVRGDHWDWEEMAQFLASRGYVVIEPDFRGSTGYGYDFFQAGFKQWGLKMQDDVSDAMDFASSKDYIDPKRVCIAGASYGGYATLMGLAKEPDRYRCGFEWVGVTDINLMYSIDWSDASDLWKQYGMPEMVGDSVKDAAQLKATSPIELAARITQPLLMAYGGTDRRVPLKHGEAFRDAVEVHNHQVEWIVYPYESHGWRALETNVDFWGHVETFLAKNLAPQ